MSDTTQKSCTRPQNTNKHPGLPDLPAKGRQRWTKAQIVEDKRILKESREVQEQAVLEGLQQLAAMQKEMEKAEELTIVNKPKPKVLTTENADESGQDDSGHVQEETSEKLKTQKCGKISLKDAINNAQDSIAMPGIRSQEPHVEDKKGKSSAKSTNLKFSLAGHVNGWVSDIAPDERSKASSASKSYTAASPSHWHMGPAPRLHLYQVLVGSFANDTLDDSQEYLETIALKTKEKKSFIKITTNTRTDDATMGSKGQSDLNVPMDAEASMPSDFEADFEDDGPTDFEDNDPMDAEDDVENDVGVLEDNFKLNKDVKMSEDSDGGSDLSFHHLNNKKCKLASVHTKPHRVLFRLSSSDEEHEAPLTAVVGVVAKKAMRVTSLTSVAVSKAAATAKPPAKKVKTENGADDDTKHMLVPLPSHWIEKRYKSRSTYRNSDLPPQCQDQWWPKHFLSTLYLWASSQNDLWQFADTSLVEVLQSIFDVVYPDLQYKVTAQGSVFGVATQRLAEWRSNFGSTGLTIMIDFFAQNKDTNPKDLSEALMEEFMFLFEDLDHSDKMKAFRSPFMIYIVGHTHVTAIKTDVLAASGMAGVLALCATSLKCAVKCLGAGAIDIDADILDMCPAQLKRKLRTPKTLNK
ncbi:uncharacterized protein EDB93DRAFT_1100137 [Suillus bovinus]|uniref:uncharacterized protein n=1 Tax=Suillus bovinus TaxID=48563 RepID=UPI001B867975|nr:uncharacterized protein EDB93DRAFT_1100137 [Suillus bovinus]KAG2159112.1 hypothetical protein EDB93DRAFT_1100137 [Suillus bovinus]